MLGTASRIGTISATSTKSSIPSAIPTISTGNTSTSCTRGIASTSTTSTMSTTSHSADGFWMVLDALDPIMAELGPRVSGFGCLAKNNAGPHTYHRKPVLLSDGHRQNRQIGQNRCGQTCSVGVNLLQPLARESLPW